MQHVSRQDLAYRIVERVEYHGRRIVELMGKSPGTLTSLELAERSWHVDQMLALTGILYPSGSLEK